MLQEYDTREIQNDFFSEVIFPILSLDFKRAKKFLNRTPEEKILDIQEKSGLSLTLNSENHKRGLVGDLLESMREQIAIADFCKQENIPIEFEEEGWRKGEYTDGTINSFFSRMKKMSVLELESYLNKYNLSDSYWNPFLFSLREKQIKLRYQGYY